MEIAKKRCHHYGSIGPQMTNLHVFQVSKYLLANESLKWPCSLNHSQGSATGVMDTWLALLLITKAAGTSLNPLDKIILLGMSGMIPTCHWRPVQALVQGSFGSSNCSWRTSCNKGLNLVCVIFQMNIACLDKILYLIDTKPASIKAKDLEVAKGTCKINSRPCSEFVQAHPRCSAFTHWPPNNTK